MAEPLLSARITENVRRWAAGEELIGPVDPDARLLTAPRPRPSATHGSWQGCWTAGCVIAGCGDLGADGEEGDDAAERAEAGGDPHRGREAVAEAAAVLPAEVEADQRRQQRHREQPRHPGDGVVHAGADAEVAVVDRRQHRAR